MSLSQSKDASDHSIFYELSGNNRPEPVDGKRLNLPSVCLCSEFLGKTPGQTVQKWVPSRSTRRDDISSNEKERHDAIFRKVRG